MQKTYTLVEVPLVGYALRENSFYFGYNECISKTNYQIKTYLDSRISKLEETIDKELNKGNPKILLEGIGGVKGDIFKASRIGSACIILGLEDSTFVKFVGPMMVLPFVFYPLISTYFFKHYGEKCAFEYIKEHLNENKNSYDSSYLQKKIDEYGLKEKIERYAEIKKQGNFKSKVKRFFKLEDELETKSKEISYDFQNLIEICDKQITWAKDKTPYETIKETYSGIKLIYDYTWWQKMPVIIGK